MSPTTHKGPRPLGAPRGAQQTRTQSSQRRLPLAYRFAGKQKTISCGIYPAVILAMARARRDAAKRLLADGVDPSVLRKAERRAMAPAEALGIVADEWLVTKMQRENKAPRTLDRARWLLRVLKDQIGHRPIGEIEPPELLDALRNTEARGHHETVSRLRSVASQIFRYGIATGRCKRDPAADLRGALTSPVEKHRAAITNPAEVGALMRATHIRAELPVWHFAYSP